MQLITWSVEFIPHPDFHNLSVLAANIRADPLKSALIRVSPVVIPRTMRPTSKELGVPEVYCETARTTPMQTANRHALKEWAVVCRALDDGRQTVLLRSGGLADRPGGFTLEHREFWLFATRFHQSPEELSDDAAALWEALAASQPPAGMIRLPLYAVVESSFELSDEWKLAHLPGLHVLAPQTVHDRFHYRQPGLTVLLVRAYRPPQPIDLPDSPHFAGCHSWVELPADLPTDGLQPVLAADAFSAQTRRLDQLFSRYA
jgi:hypothetical protein